jgi:hypothetical protein
MPAKDACLNALEASVQDALIHLDQQHELTAKLVDTDCKTAALTLLSHGLRTSHRLRGQRNNLRKLTASTR